ncbi:methionine ABC transporter permease [Helicobacter monodelphidis]|uniref:methionine ABC transporter permease n=1 Tax=Helicobacter sp. 15-1451 TaxID=2004995 RepID=UPI000DCBB2E8|nr:methionine ABC transporter permease [Helicobacter sp. 15-1451]RAX57508.1 methionine ABC transporter permease [Helicobacter sp. 15-1451]
MFEWLEFIENKTIIILIQATLETLYMSFISTFFATILGLILAILLILFAKDSLYPMPIVHKCLDILINTCRSFPFLVLIILLFPLTAWIVGKSTGSTAMIVPLSIGIAPFIARIIENAMKEVDKGVIEAAKSFGASDMQIIFKVMIVEALPSIFSGVILALIMAIGFSAMAGTVGGGGLGAVAVNYGVYRFNVEILTYTAVILVIMVQVIQSIGDFIYNHLKK